MNIKRMFLIIFCLGLLVVLRAGMTYYFVASTGWQLDKFEKTRTKEFQPMQKFAEGYYYSEHYSYDVLKRPDFGKLPLITDDYKSTKAVSIGNVIREVKEHLPKNYTDFTAKLPRIIIKEINSIETSRPKLKIPEYDCLPSNLREYRSTSRFWADVGRLLLYEGKESSTLAISAGILLIAHNLDRDPENGPIMVNRLTGITIRNIANSLIIEQMGKTRMSAEQIKSWIPKFQKLRQGILPISDSYKVETKLYETISKFLTSKGSFAGKMFLRNKKEFEKLNAKTIDKLIESDEGNYSEKIKAHREVASYLEDIHDSLSISPQLFKNLLFSPSKMVVKFFGFNFYPNFRRAYEAEAKSQQLADGAIAAMILRAYMTENNKTPESLQQVESWYGEKLPSDIFADMAPLQLNKKGLISVGPDMKANTEDDLVFMLLNVN